MQCSPNISMPQISHSSPEGCGVSGACSCCVCSSLTAKRVYGHGQYNGRVARLTPASSAGARIVSGCRTDPEEIGDAGGAQRLERAVGEDLLGLTERGGESPGENLQRREALLKLGDLDG